MVQVELESCMDCPNHRVISDPDPYDWFCDDDVAVVCTKKEKSKDTIPNGQPFKVITQACRPYNTRRETNIPDWCPLRR